MIRRIVWTWIPKCYFVGFLGLVLRQSVLGSLRICEELTFLNNSRIWEDGLELQVFLKS